MLSMPRSFAVGAAVAAYLSLHGGALAVRLGAGVVGGRGRAEAFRLALAVGDCSAEEPQGWSWHRQEEAEVIPFALGQVLSLAASFTNGLPCLQAKGRLRFSWLRRSASCFKALEVRRPSLGGSAFKACVEVHEPRGALPAASRCRAAYPAAADGGSVAEMRVEDSPDTLVCAKFRGRSLVGITLLSELRGKSSLATGLEAIQRAQDLETFLPHGAVQLLSDSDELDGEANLKAFFDKLYGIAFAFPETTRDRESIMVETCTRATRKLSLQQETPPDDIVEMLFAFCNLAGRDEFGAPSLYSESRPAISTLPEACLLIHADSYRRHAQACEDLKYLQVKRSFERQNLIDRKAALRRRVKREHRADPSEVVLVVGAGPVGLVHALMSSLTGARVLVMEGRAEFTRLNAMAVQDFQKALKLLGINAMHEYQYYLDSGVMRDGGTYPIMSASNAQRLLARAASAYGVEVRFRHEFLAYCPPEVDQSNWRDGLRAAKWFAVFTEQPDEDFDSLEPAARIRASSRKDQDWFQAVCERRAKVSAYTVRVEFDLLIGAEGIRSPSRDQALRVGTREAEGSLVVGPYGERYMPTEFRARKVPLVKGAVVAVRSEGRREKCFGAYGYDEKTRLQTHIAYTFPYLAWAIHGYCWTGFIMKQIASVDLERARAEDAGETLKLADAIIKQSFPEDNVTVEKIMIDQKHKPHVAVFDIPMQAVNDPVAFQLSPGGVRMALLVGGDASITPWFPASYGTNEGAKRAVLWFEEEGLVQAGLLLGALRAAKENPGRDAGPEKDPDVLRLRKELRFLIGSQMIKQVIHIKGVASKET